MKPRVPLLLTVLWLGIASLSAETRNLYLPPWYEKAAVQIHTLTLTAVPFPRIKLAPSCAVYLTNALCWTVNGEAKVTLFIDLRKSPPTFPLFILGPNANGEVAQPWLQLVCHLTLVPIPCTVTGRGDRFMVDNLTDQPLEVEFQTNVMDLHVTSRQASGTGKRGARLKFRNLPEIQLPGHYQP